MKIEINNTNTKSVTALLIKFLELSEASNYNYLDDDYLFIGYNENSGFSYIYLESNPSLSLCLDIDNELCIIYSSTLDGLELIKYDLGIIKDLSSLDDLLNDVYTLEDSIRDGDSKNKELKEQFINEMLQLKWEEL